MAPRPLDDDAEEVAKQELEQHLQRLDLHDAERAGLAVRVNLALARLARSRGLAFLRLETFRDELRREQA